MHSCVIVVIDVDESSWKLIRYLKQSIFFLQRPKGVPLSDTSDRICRSKEYANNDKKIGLKLILEVHRVFFSSVLRTVHILTLRLLMSYIYGAPSKARNANVVYIWTYVWQR